MGNGEENTMKHASMCAKLLGLPLYKISASKRKDTRIDKLFNVNPYNFLALLDNASCVVTNSFHGTSFSLILGKQFWTCVAEGSNQRITSLLDKAGVLGRLIVENTQPDYSIGVDINLALNNLSNYINQSENFIKNSINE